MDDFALKKRYRYASALVDFETGEIIDLLESRETKEVSIWLKQFPQLEIIARDGSRSYANAIKDAHPQSLQVSDRFHLISRLIEIGKKFFIEIYLAESLSLSRKKRRKLSSVFSSMLLVEKRFYMSDNYHK
ncbi:transposase [Enterococcus avium]|uniref:transposase n=1 Tax=Enterococcus avium TaxID=33945 RepID=UPI003393BC86